jgi:hypothetical protein
VPGRSEEEEQRSSADLQQVAGQSHRIVACLTTTYLFAKIRPQLLVKHVQTLQPYLNIKCFVQVGEERSPELLEWDVKDRPRSWDWRQR